MKKNIGLIFVLGFLLGCCNSSETVILDMHYLENYPEYIGGQKVLEEHIKEKILQSSKEYRGRVYLIITISRKGEIVNPTIYKSTTKNSKADKMALEIVKRLPSFRPATLQGKPIASKYSIVVDFDKYNSPPMDK